MKEIRETACIIPVVAETDVLVVDSGPSGLAVNSECLSGLIFVDKKCLLKALGESIIHCHQERNHQGKDNRLLFSFPEFETKNQNGKINCRSRLGGKLKYYYKVAA
jgi:putative transposase